MGMGGSSQVEEFVGGEEGVAELGPGLGGVWLGGEPVEGAGGFGGGGGAGIEEGGGEVVALVVGGGGFLEVGGEAGSAVHDEGGVQHEEGLGGDDGGVAAAGGHGGVGVVELFEDVVEVIADDGEVEGAARAFVGGVVLGSVVEDELTIAEGEGFATELEIEGTGDGEEGVAELLGFEALAIHAGEEFVFWVGVLVRLGGGGV